MAFIFYHRISWANKLILSIIIIFLLISTVGVPTNIDRMLFSVNSWHSPTVSKLGFIERISQRIQTYELVRVVLKQNDSQINNPQDEIELIVQKLLPFKKLLLSQIQVKHRATQNSTLVFGFGYCDQVNAVAAIALAQFFDRVEMIGIQGTKTHEGHSFGRVWLPKMQNWVYFDLWSDDLFLLALNKTAEVQILRRVDSSGAEKTHSLADNSPFIKIYRDLAQAKPYLGFPKTALNYLLRSAILNHQSYLMPYVVTKNISLAVSTNEALIPKKILKIYLNARREHIFGNTHKARKLYKKFLNEAPPNSPFTRAAEIFQTSL